MTGAEGDDGEDIGHPWALRGSGGERRCAVVDSGLWVIGARDRGSYVVLDGSRDRATVGWCGAKPVEEEATRRGQISAMRALGGVRGGDRDKDNREYDSTGLGRIG